MCQQGGTARFIWSIFYWSRRDRFHLMWASLEKTFLRTDQTAPLPLCSLSHPLIRVLKMFWDRDMAVKRRSPDQDWSQVLQQCAHVTWAVLLPKSRHHARRSRIYSRDTNGSLMVQIVLMSSLEAKRVSQTERFASCTEPNYNYVTGEMMVTVWKTNCGSCKCIKWTQWLPSHLKPKLLRNI